MLWLEQPVQAQHHTPASGQPYAADTSRTIKALSPDETEGLLEGRGLGLARAAELNSYPGPKHVLEWADRLALTEAQRAETERLVGHVRHEARVLGAEIVAAERELDALFAEGQATQAAVAALTDRLGALQGRLRAVHLQAHVAMRQVLSADQIAAYDRLRGYTD